VCFEKSSRHPHSAAPFLLMLVPMLLPAQRIALHSLRVGFGAASCTASTPHILVLLREAVLAL
jgi:hypothetical protein